MKLIDKSALVAEIERRIKTNKECMLGLRNLDYYQGKVDALNDTVSFLDTLEVIEIGVDVGSPEGDIGRKTVQVIDADGNISDVTFNKAHKGE